MYVEKHKFYFLAKNFETYFFTENCKLGGKMIVALWSTSPKEGKKNSCCFSLVQKIGFRDVNFNCLKVLHIFFFL